MLSQEFNAQGQSLSSVVVRTKRINEIRAPRNQFFAPKVAPSRLPRAICPTGPLKTQLTKANDLKGAQLHGLQTTVGIASLYLVRFAHCQSLSYYHAKWLATTDQEAFSHR
jgi:hypothetical protein